MKLSKEQVQHVAKLANLPITANEEELYSEQLSKILDYIDSLNRVVTTNIAPTYNTTGLSNVQRKDDTEPSLTQEAALDNAGDKKDGYFSTKGVFEND